jgi:hypothetical protein
MKYIDDSHLDKTETLEILFNKDGQISSETKENKYAKIVGKASTDLYYIRTHLNVPYDPLGSYGHRENYIETKLKKVSKDTFDFYVMYLKTNNSLYLTRASRGFLND